MEITLHRNDYSDRLIEANGIAILAIEKQIMMRNARFTHLCKEPLKESDKKIRRRVKMPCKYCIDEICCNADCNYCCDFCPVYEFPEVCKFAEEGEKANADEALP